MNFRVRFQFWLNLLFVVAFGPSVRLGSAESLRSPGSWKWASTWCGLGLFEGRSTDELLTALNDVLALTWTTPSSRWPAFGDRFSEPRNLHGCVPERSPADLRRGNCIVVALLRSQGSGDAAFLETAMTWGQMGAYYAVAMSLADSKRVEAIKASLDGPTRAWVEKAFHPLGWLQTTLQSDNPFVELASYAGIDIQRERRVERQLGVVEGNRILQLRASPFMAVGWTLRWRAEEKLVAAYRMAVGQLVDRTTKDCSSLLALHTIATPMPPADLVPLLDSYRDLPACSSLADSFRQRGALHESMRTQSPIVFASAVVVVAAKQSTRNVDLERPTARALSEANVGLIPRNLGDLYENELKVDPGSARGNNDQDNLHIKATPESALPRQDVVPSDGGHP